MSKSKHYDDDMDKFINLCFSDPLDPDAVEEAIKELDIDVNDPYYSIGKTAASKGFCDLLKLLIDKSGLEVKEDASVLSAAALYGKVDCVKLLLSYGADPSSLRGTTSYGNYKSVALVFDEYFAHQNSVDENAVRLSGEIIDSVEDS